MEAEQSTYATRRKRLRLPLSQNERDKVALVTDRNQDMGTNKNIEDQNGHQNGMLMTPARLKTKRKMFETRNSAEKKNRYSPVLLNSSLDSNDAESIKLPHSHSGNAGASFVSYDESLQDDTNGTNNKTQELNQTRILFSTPSFGNSSFEDGGAGKCIGNNTCDFKRIMQSPSTRASGIRIGEEYQCVNIPVAGSYLTEAPIVQMEQVWDHNMASTKGCVEFLERHCPKQNLEVAMSLLSKNGYRHSGLLSHVRNLPPNDGSDWIVDEQHRFHLLFNQFGHNLKKVAIAMGKSVLSCTLFHYGIGQKRQTRRSRTSLAAQPICAKNIRLSETLTTQSNPRISIPSTNEPRECQEKDCKWDFYISELKKYKIEFGHTLVPKVFPPNQPLSSWVFKIRGLYRKLQGSGRNATSYLTNAKLKELNDIGFSFAAKNTQEQAMIENSKRVLREEADWQRSYSSLCEFKDTHGHTLVPKKFYENSSLSAWVFKQRHQYALMKDGKMNRLNEDRIQKLNNIGFVWVAKKDDKWKELEHERIVSSYDESWEKMYEELLKFKKKHGHTVVPKIYPVNQQLASFVFCQRNQFRLRETGQTNTLTDARLEKLNNIDFAFSVRKNRKSP